MEIKEFTFQENNGGTYIEYLKQIERELSIKIGQPEIRDNKRRQDVIGMMLDITRDAIDSDMYPKPEPDPVDVDILEVIAESTGYAQHEYPVCDQYDTDDYDDRTTNLCDLMKRWPK